MARGRDSSFDGSFETSRYADDSLEKTIERGAEKGIFVSPTESGGVQKTTYTEKGERVDRWEPGKPGDYPHYGIDEDGIFFHK
jgi:hypothetical protein